MQFNHRMLAYTTLAGVAGLWAYGSRLPALPPAARLCLNALALATAGQVALGITTLLTYVPVPLGAAHQGGAMVLFTLALGLLYAIKPAPSLGTFRRGAGPGRGGAVVAQGGRRAGERRGPPGGGCCAGSRSAASCNRTPATRPASLDLIPSHIHPCSPPARLLIAKYGNAATAAAVVGIGGTVVNMH